MPWNEILQWLCIVLALLLFGTVNNTNRLLFHDFIEHMHKIHHINMEPVEEDESEP